MYRCVWIAMAMMMISPVCCCFAGELQNVVVNEKRSLEAIPDIYVTRLSERILQLKVRGPLGTNIVVVATQKGLVVIDTYTAPVIFEQVSEIVQKQFGRRDFAYVINSHRDVDHSGGNGYFEDVIMVGHEKMLRQLKERHGRRDRWERRYRNRVLGWIRGREEKLAGLDKTSEEALELRADLRLLSKVEKGFEKGFPVVPANPRANLTFTDRLVLELGDITIECHDCQVGHTPGDILIYIPEEEFLFTGDAAQIYMQKNVNMELWLAQLEHFSQPDKPVKMVLGGHDERPGTKQELRNLHDYFQATWESVQEAHRKGLSLDQIKQQYSIDNKMSRFRAIFDVEDLSERHAYNIELVVKRLSNSSD